jgi:hypothetical protein
MPERTSAYRCAMLLSVLASAMWAVTGCSRPDDQRTETVDPRAVEQARTEWPAGVAAQVDSGNAAYRAGAFEISLKHFEEATRLGAQVPAAWFGLYMARHATGDLAGAESALQRAQSLVPGATLLQHSERDTLR